MPRWNLHTIFQGFETAEYQAAHAEVDRLLGKWESVIAGAEGGQSPVEALSEGVQVQNALMLTLWPVRAYAYGRNSSDSSDDAAKAELSKFAKIGSRMSALNARWLAWVAGVDLAAAAQDSDVVREHRFALEKAQLFATKLMSPAEEELAAKMGETGGGAWARFYGDFSSRVTADVNGETLPISAVRNLAYDADAEVREAAYQAELAAWERVGAEIAFAMNGVKGETLMLCERRGWGHPLDETLADNNMDRAALNALLGAAEKSFPAFRRYLRAKAKALGYSGGLKWCDLFAAVGEDAPYEWDDAKQFVEDGFGRYSQEMAELANRSYREEWIDVGPRTGKRDGAFCMGVHPGESRILMNFKPAFGSVATLAHELGHAYHNWCLRERTPLNIDTPMPLAETASIFCETIIKRAALKEASGAQKLAILDGSLQGANQVVVDIISRYRFETMVFEKRAERDLSASELCEMMRQAQLSTYGDGLADGSLHPYMWAVKPHYYSYGSYYNFPYLFGLLFALGLYAVYQEQPDGFHARYDRLLSSTGLASVSDLAAEFGIDVRSEAFWAGSLSVLEDDINEFEALVG